MQTSVLVTGDPQAKSSSIMFEGEKAENAVSDTSHQSPSHKTTYFDKYHHWYLFICWLICFKKTRKTLP